MSLIKVRVKSTGQTGTMDSSEFDPKVFEQVSQPQTQVAQQAAAPQPQVQLQQPTQESQSPYSDALAKSGLLGKILSLVTTPGERGLRTVGGEGIALGAGVAGLLGNKSAQELALRGDIPLLTKEQENIFRNDRTGSSSLMQGAKTAGDLTTYLPGGAGKSAFATGAVRGLGMGVGNAKAQTLGDLATPENVAEIATSTAGGGLTEGLLSNALPFLKNRFGKSAQEAGAGLETRSLVKKFGKPNIKEGGVPAFKNFAEHGINVRGSIDDIASSASDVLNTEGPKVHQIATELTNNGVQVQADDINNFLKNELANKKTVEMKAPIEAVMQNVKQTFGDGPMNLDEFYIAKQEWGTLGKWSPTATTAENTKAAVYESLYKKANDIINKAFKENGYSNFAELNNKVSTAIKAAHFAERRGAQIVMDNPLGLMDIAASGVGAATAGGPGAIGAYALNKAAQSPTVQGAVGRGMQSVGAGMQNQMNPTLASILRTGAAIPAVGMATGGLSKGVQPLEQSPQEQVLAPTPQSIQQPQTTEAVSSVSNITPQMLQLARMSLSDKEYSKLKDMYDIQETAAKKGNESMTQQKRKIAMNNALNTYRQVKSLSDAAPAGLEGYLRAKAGSLPGVEGGSSEDLKRVTEGLAKSIATAFAGESGVATDRDVERWLGLMPKPGDTKGERKRALDRLETAIRINMDSMGMSASDFGL